MSLSVIFTACCHLSSLKCVCVRTLPASHEAERLEQEARGKLERQKIMDQAEAERTRKELLELEALR